MGTGKRSVQTSNRLSGRVTLREVAANDTDIDSVAEVLDTRIPPTAEGRGEVPRGDHATLVLYAVLADGATAATISLYGKCNDEETEGESSSSSPDLGDDWSYYDDWAVDTKNLMVVLPDMPASEYKVLVTGIAGGGRVIIREQHSS